MRGWLAISIVVAAAAADTAGAQSFARYLLLAAIPVVAGCALGRLGDLLDLRETGPVEPEALLEPFLYGLVLLLLVGGAAAGALAFALSGSLALLCVEALVGLATELRRPALDVG